MAKTLITIITVVYNDFKNIEKTIQAILDQTYKDIEYIIIDGGSQDGTADVIKKYESNLAYWISEKDRGIYDAMNKAINKSNGEWIIFMNSGDLFYNNNVLQDIFFNKSYPVSDIIYGNTLALNSKNIIIPPKKISKNFFYSNTICHQSIFFKKEMFLKNNLYNLNYRIIADRIWLLEAAIGNANFKHVDFIVSVWDEEGFSKNNILLYNKESNILGETYFGNIERIILKLKLKINLLLKNKRVV